MSDEEFNRLVMEKMAVTGMPHAQAVEAVQLDLEPRGDVDDGTGKPVTTPEL